MAEIVNLRMARKRAARQVKEDKADHNRALHSVPARERRKAAAVRDLAERRLDGANRGNADDGD